MFLSELTFRYRHIKWAPLMELLRGDQPCSSVDVPEVTGLPPGVILHADNLEDVASFKGDSCIFARNGGILIRIIVKKSSQKQLRRENHLTSMPSNRQTGKAKKITHSTLSIDSLFSFPTAALWTSYVSWQSLPGGFSHMLVSFLRNDHDHRK